MTERVSVDKAALNKLIEHARACEIEWGAEYAPRAAVEAGPLEADELVKALDVKEECG